MTPPGRDPEQLLPGETVQLLAPDGTVTEHPDHPFELDDDWLRARYREMVIARRIDREAINLQRQGQMAVYASCLGQEAAQVGSAAALADEDWVFPSYRELAVAVARDIDVIGLMHFYRGTWLGDHDPIGNRFALSSIPIATQVLHATGFAMGMRLDGRDVVTISYFGDGATSEGDTHEAMTFAGVYDTPIVFFVQNNQWAISVPRERQTAAPTLAHKAVGYGLPGVRCDGNDLLASYVVTRAAVEAARRGEGATVIEAITYRMEAHTTSDDPTRYRSEAEVEEAAQRDPIARVLRLLERRDAIDDATRAAIDEAADERAAEVRRAIYDAPHGDPLELFEHVYVDPSGHFEDQRDEMRASLGGV
jgi:2-oxoisovalerate dehydrogenase E1 component alpha subunit